MIPSMRQIILSARLTEAKRLGKHWLTSSEDQISQVQLSLLRKQWQEASENIPYYKTLVSSGKAPKDFHSFQDFTRNIPILTREILLEKKELFQRRKKPNGTLMTAGSTGDPLSFGIWRNELVKHTGLPQWVGRLHNGMREKDRVFILWGHSHLLGTGTRGKRNGFFRSLKDHMMNYERVNAYQIDLNTSKHYFRRMMKFNPKIILGYSCTLDLWVQQCRAQKLSVKDLNVKLCIACSENFPRPESREMLENFFNCPVIMEYGGVDFGVCAYEDKNTQKYQTFWWSHFLETQPKQSKHQFLVTNLTYRYLPLFRYANGDECESPVTLRSGHVKSFSKVRGRVNDLLRMPDGRSIHSVGLFHCIHQEPVWSIQLVKAKERFRIKLAASEFSPSCENRIRKRLHDLHPQLENAPIEVVNDVVTNRAGKRRWIIDEEPGLSEEV